MLTSSISWRCDSREVQSQSAFPAEREKRPEISRSVALKSSGTGQWLAMTRRLPAPTKVHAPASSSATSPPDESPACWVAAALAFPAVSQCRQDHEVRIEMQVENFLEGQQPI